MEKSKENRLIAVLREAAGLIQMLLYKELRENLTSRHKAWEKEKIALLAGAVTGEVFGASNPDEKFVQFREQHHGEIEQELLALPENLPEICGYVTDSLRVLALCDHHDFPEKESDGGSSLLLVKAQNYGYLAEERETPLPSTFMTSVRTLGTSLGLVMPITEINPDEEKELLH